MLVRKEMPSNNLFLYGAALFLVVVCSIYFFDFLRLSFALALVVVIPYAMFSLHFEPTKRSNLNSYALLALVCLCAPLLIPVFDESQTRPVRMIFANLFGAYVIGIFNLALSEAKRKEENLGFYQACFGAFSYTTIKEQAQPQSVMGRLRLQRAGIKLGILAVMIWGVQLVPDVHASYYLSGLYLAGLFYLFVTAVCDLVLGLLALYGVIIGDPFRDVLTASSPSEFWGRRWNRPMNKWFQRNIYSTLAGNASPFVLVLVTFFVSGVIHQYPVWIGGGGAWMTLTFFMLQGVAVLTHRLWIRKRPKGFVIPKTVAIGLHHIWIVGTVPLFFMPLNKVFSFILVPESGVLALIFIP